MSTDVRSGITSDPNRDDDPEYIALLVGHVVMVNVETVRVLFKNLFLLRGKSKTLLK